MLLEKRKSNRKILKRQKIFGKYKKHVFSEFDEKIH